MTKIEELKEKIANLLDIGDTDFDREGGFTPQLDLAYEQADQILNLLAEMGCGFKVEKEFPDSPFLHDTAATIGDGCSLARTEAYLKAQNDMLKAGFTGFEPVILLKRLNEIFAEPLNLMDKDKREAAQKAYDEAWESYIEALALAQEACELVSVARNMRGCLT